MTAIAKYYYKLYNLNLITLEKIPAHWRPQVSAQVEADKAAAEEAAETEE